MYQVWSDSGFWFFLKHPGGYSGNEWKRPGDLGEVVGFKTMHHPRVSILKSGDTVNQRRT